MKLVIGDEAKLSEETLDSVTGGVTMVAPGNGGYYACCSCGYTDFYVVDTSQSYITVRCKRCNCLSRIPQ